MKEIKLTIGKIALVDDDNFEMLSKIKWSTSFRCATNGKIGKMHRYILGITNPKIIVDHIDRNPFNNQKSNLRICSSAENAQNKNGRGKSKYLGVSIVQTTKKYKRKDGVITVIKSKPIIVAKIKRGSKYKHLGIFKTEESAAQAYNDAALAYYGVNAGINII